ncbi:Kinetochore protein Nuf2 [Dissostichus eleginoides]|uniref:Kinetochore protein Nuf2 n=1 Tax=Dissostichus eleginoides TaxID=100907 RepID=A0AAD9CIK1_DISEL|nr:Kinetochore protein Nuf2 [Dissostichus eleginoides]
MTENTFPVYTADAIVTFYRAEVLTGQEAKNFNKSDLIPVPKPESIQTLYMRVLHLLYRFRPELHSMVPLLVNIANPQYHEATLAITSVFLLMRQFLPICLVHDFALSDLLVPKKQKTLTILSAVMNYLHFRKQRMGADRDQLQALNKGISEAQKKIETLNTIPPEQQAEADELAASLSELQTASQHKFHEVNMRNERVAERKTKNAEKTQKLIVESPEELKSQMERMRENVKTIKCTIVSALEKQASSHTDLCRVAELTAQYEKKQKELKNLCSEEGQLKRTLVMKLDKESKLNIRRQKKKDIKEQHVQEVLGEYNHIHQKREEMADKIQEISSETQQLKAKIQSLRDVCSQETKKAQALYDTLSTSMDAMHRRSDMQTANLKQVLGKMSASLKK